MPAPIQRHSSVVRTRARVPATVIAVLVVGLAGADVAGAINRCEGRDGRITYTDEPCPATVRSARKVDDSPPVQARNAPVREAAESKDAKDGKAEPKESEGKGGVAAGSEAAKGMAMPALQAGRVTTSSSPEQEMQRLDEQRERQRRQCAEATRRVDYATKDLQAAVGADRASAELALRRAQEEARGVCPPR